MLDSRAPPAQYAEEEKAREEDVQAEVNRLMRQVLLWRVANSAQWTAWGIVQAKVDGMEEAFDSEKAHPPPPHHSNGCIADASANGLALAQPMSDPVSPEDAGVARAAHDRRPEGLVAEALAQGHDMDHSMDDEDEFDYLAYAQDRAMFFWGDVIGMGIVGKEVLGEEMRKRVKTVQY
jgi:choline kinase